MTKTGAPTFRLQFALAEVPRLASGYLHDSPEYDAEIERTVAPAVRRRGHYEREEFLVVCAWKTPRSKPLCAYNDESLVREATSVALGARHERLRIGVLRHLRGVSWPTASVLLHWGHREPYPILDYRALEAMGVEKAPVDFDFGFWWAYVEECRRLAAAANVDMRTLDRALWQFSKEQSPRRT